MTLRRLKLIGVALPVLFVLVLELVRFLFIEKGLSSYAPHIALALVTVLAVIAFSFVMFHLIARAQAETAQVVANLRRRQREGHAFYDVLLRISNQDPLADILAAVARHARELSASPVPCDERDREFLSTLSRFASIAVTGARVRESERQSAILAERERLARELHDSLAQVLGAVHLRLRALASGESAITPATALELTELADVCEEGYGDARGAILDLHESSRADGNLLDGLRAYLDKYSHQCGIATSLQATVAEDLTLPPRSEVQIIRVVQEALANVRKHSGAAAATVRIAQEDGMVTFAIEDDGCGFDVDDEPVERGGFGLHSMRERMETIGGTLLAESARGRGTRIVAVLSSVPAQTPVPAILSAS
jgi:signal transduction histidine kinase